MNLSRLRFTFARLVNVTFELDTTMYKKSSKSYRANRTDYIYTQNRVLDVEKKISNLDTILLAS